jgi:hypothetical protein
MEMSGEETSVSVAASGSAGRQNAPDITSRNRERRQTKSLKRKRDNKADFVPRAQPRDSNQHPDRGEGQVSRQVNARVPTSLWSMLHDELIEHPNLLRGCALCGKDNNKDLLLTCAACITAHHTYCVGVDAVGGGDWVCESCGLKQKLPPPQTTRELVNKPYLRNKRTSTSTHSGTSRSTRNGGDAPEERQELWLKQQLSVLNQPGNSLPRRSDPPHPTSLREFRELGYAGEDEDLFLDHEAKRQRRKVNFLISQSELHAHFAAKGNTDGVESSSEAPNPAVPNQKRQDDQEEAHIASKAGGINNYGNSPSPLTLKTPFPTQSTSKLFITSTISQDCTNTDVGSRSLLIAIKDRPRNLAFKSSGFEPGNGKRVMLR